MKNAPCRDCQDRDYGCHSYCQEYIKYKITKELLRIKKAKIEQSQIPTDPNARVRNRSNAFNGRGRC